jgi:glycosyltransferase involved in cell wall biosynthesis
MITEQPLVEILLATFKGADKLDKQINSLLNQTYPNCKLLIRDDGSDDGTTDIIESFATEYSEYFRFVKDSSGRLGPAGSFSTLLTCSCADYVMFCDQDDVWLPEKAALTLEKMFEVENAVGKQGPVLIHSDLKVVDDDSMVVADSLWDHQNIHPRSRESINRLLVQNVVTGCTVMINKSLRDLALPIPSEAIMHDWWLALVASAFGKIGHVDQPTMLYRQHGANEIGAKAWSLLFVLKNVFGNDGQVREGLLKVQRQAQVFLKEYQDELPVDIRTVVECYAYIDQRPYLEKVYLLIKHRLFKAGLIRNLGLWAHI